MNPFGICFFPQAALQPRWIMSDSKSIRTHAGAILCPSRHHVKPFRDTRCDPERNDQRDDGNGTTSRGGSDEYHGLDFSGVSKDIHKLSTRGFAEPTAFPPRSLQDAQCVGVDRWWEAGCLSSTTRSYRHGRFLVGFLPADGVGGGVCLAGDELSHLPRSTGRDQRDHDDDRPQQSMRSLLLFAAALTLCLGALDRHHLPTAAGSVPLGIFFPHPAVSFVHLLHRVGRFRRRRHCTHEIRTGEAHEWAAHGLDWSSMKASSAQRSADKLLDMRQTGVQTGERPRSDHPPCIRGARRVVRGAL